MQLPDRDEGVARAEAMAVYSADGQADDATGNDAGAEALAAGKGRNRDGADTEDGETDEMPHGPS